MVGISLEELEMMNEVAILASGKSKARSLFALLQKGCVDHIIIDQEVAEYLLAKEYWAGGLLLLEFPFFHKKKSPLGLFHIFYYKRQLRSAASSSNPGLPRKANIFFL